MPKLLGTNAKLSKGNKLGVITAGLSLAPAMESGRNMCPHSTGGCVKACIYTSGMGAMPATQRARIEKTHWFQRDRSGFLAQLVDEVAALERKGIREGAPVAVRLNVFSDWPWERTPVEIDGVTYPNLMRAFPGVIFYDYTKWPRRLRGERKGGALPPNYSLTFSLAENNDDEAARWLEAGENVAVVFDARAKRGKRQAEQLPSDYTIAGITARVIDGDESDARWLDPRGVIVGLHVKADGVGDTTGFVRESSPATPIDLALAA